MKKCIVCDDTISGQKKLYCSNKCKQKHHYDRVKEQTNTYHSQTIRAYRRKVYLIDYLGGCCKVCKYNKNLSALEFHHRDPNIKDSQLDIRTLSNRSMKYILEEISKCDLLCSNCHREYHNPELGVEEIRELVEKNESSSRVS
jgi:predicted nucleic acid-binding Zn ribbon protein